MVGLVHVIVGISIYTQTTQPYASSGDPVVKQIKSIKVRSSIILKPIANLPSKGIFCPKAFP
jgi:hypothetical protein